MAAVLANNDEQFSADSPEDFVRKVLPYARKIGKELGVDPISIIAHAALESDFGRRAPGNNFFGVKDSSRWAGKSQQQDTTEFRSGVGGKERATFRAYNSPAESFDDLGNTLSTLPRYAGALGTGANSAAYVDGLVKGGYATDPNYRKIYTGFVDQVKAAMPQPVSSDAWDAVSVPRETWDAVSQPTAASQPAAESGAAPSSQDWDAVSVPKETWDAVSQPPTAAPPAAAPAEEPGLLSSLYTRAFRSTPQDLRKALAPVIDPVMTGVYEARQGSNPLSLATGIESDESAAEDVASNQRAIDAIPVPSYVPETEARARAAAAAHQLPPGEKSGVDKVFDWMIKQSDTPVNKLGMTALAAPMLRQLKDLIPSAAGLAATGEYIKEPRAALRLALQSLASSSTSMGLGLIGGAAGGTATAGPGGTVVGAALGTGTGSFLTEYGSDIINTFREAKVDLTNKQAVMAAFRNQELMARAREHAIKRGAGVALFDAISAGIAGKVAKPIERIVSKVGIKRGGKLAGEIGEMVAQGETGAMGEEKGAEFAGDKPDPTAVAGERVGEYGPGVAEIAIQRALGVRGSKLKALKEKRRIFEEAIAKENAMGDATDEANTEAKKRIEQARMDYEQAKASAEAETVAEAKSRMQEKQSYEEAKASAESEANVEAKARMAGAPENENTPSSPSDTMQTPASTGSPTPDAGGAVAAPSPSSDQEAASTAALTPKQKKAAAEADERDALADKSDAAGFPEGAQTLRVNAARIRAEAGLPPKGKGKKKAAPPPPAATEGAAETTTPETEVPLAQTEPQVSTPTPTPHVETVEQPGEVQAGGTTAPVTSYTTEKGSTYEVTPDGTTTRNKAARPEHPGEAGPQPTSEATFYVTQEDAIKLGEIQTEGAPKRSIVKLPDGRIGVRYEEGKSKGKIEKRTVVTPQSGPAVGLTPVETWNDGSRVHFGNKITEVRSAPASQTPVSKRETATTTTASTTAKAPPASFAEKEDEVEEVRALFGLKKKPAKAENGENRAKDEAVQVFNQINGSKPEAKKMLAKRIAKLSPEAQKKVADWIEKRDQSKKALDKRIADNAGGLQHFASEAGWAEKGGHAIREPTGELNAFGEVDDQTGPVVDRTKWIARMPWFKEVQGNVTISPDSKIKRPLRERADLPKNDDGHATREAVRKAIAGEPLSTQEKRHINGMLNALDNEREEAERLGLTDYNPFEANVAVAVTAPAAETTVTAVDTALVNEAKTIDPDAFESAFVKWEESDDTASFIAEIKGIIAAHDQSRHTASNQGGGSVRQDEGRTTEEQSADDFFKEQIAASAANAAAPKVAAAQGELLPKDQTKQDLADHERKLDEKRSPNKDVPADTGGGLFSKENKQTNIEEEAATYDAETTTDDEQVTELDDDIGTTAAEDGFNPNESGWMDDPSEMSEALLSDPEQDAEAATTTGARDTSLPSTPREKIANFLGIKPRAFRRMGGAEQFAAARKALMERYGFRSIAKHASQAWRNANDHLIDGFVGLHNMAEALGLSPKMMSLNGKLSLHLQRNTRARGLFSPATNLISIFDQSDVYAHEFGHAIDYNLMEEGGGVMTPGGLSAAIRNREGTGMLPETVGDAYADLMTSIFYKGATIAHEIKLAEHQLEKAKTPKQQKQLQKRLDNLRSGAWRGHAGKTDFYERAKNGPLKKYLTKPTELVARTFEAYVANKIEQKKALGFVGFIGSHDTVYRDTTNAWMKRIYPQADERAEIFARWDALIGQLTREGIYDTSVPVGIEGDVVNLGLMDPVGQAKLTGTPLTPEIVKAKNLTIKEAKEWHKREVQRRDTLRNNLRRLTKALKEGTPNAGRELQALMRGLGSTPDGVFAFLEGRFKNNTALRQIRDTFSDALIYGRDKSIGLYRAVQQREEQLVNQVREKLSADGIIPGMPDEWASRMWDIVHGIIEPVTEEEEIQADRIRYEYERLWKMRDKHSVGIGYTDEEYQNRITHRDVADNPAFVMAVVKLRSMEKEALLEIYDKQLKKAKTDEEITEIKQNIAKTQAIDVVRQTDEQIAAMKNAKWRGHPTLGSLNEDSAKHRVFGRLADQVLKDFYLKDPVDLLSTYAASAAREMIFNERLGKDPAGAIDEMLLQASKQGLPKVYVHLLVEAMHISLGINTSGSPLPGSNLLSAWASLSSLNLLGRAVLPNISEPLGALSKTNKTTLAIMEIVKGAMSPLMSQERKARYAAADRFGRLAGILVDAGRAITAQAQATGDSSQGTGLMAQISRKGFWFNLITPLTSRQELMTNRMAAELFYDACASIRNNDKYADISSQWLREHGIKNAESFAWFMQDPDIMEKLTLEDTFRGHGRELSQGLNQYVKTTVQSPTPSTKLMIAKRGNFGLIARLTSWMSTNFRNWTTYNKDKIMSAWTGKYGDAHLTATQRLTASIMPVGTAMTTMYVAQAFFVVARMMLTNSDDWEERGEDNWDRFFSKKTQMQILQYWGLLGWLSNVLIDTTVGARTKRGIFQTAAGPFYGPLAQDVERFILYAVDQMSDTADNTNTAERNATLASFHILSTLMTGALMAVLPQSKVSGQIAGFAWSFVGTSPQMANEVADWWSGPKEGTVNPNNPMQVMKAQTKDYVTKSKEPTKDFTDEQNRREKELQDTLDAYFEQE